MHEDVQTAPFPPGAVIEGKYAVIRTLGVGGMGVVLLAKHLGLDELVALKFLQKDALANADLVQRFIQEGRAAAKIKGDHCVRMLDVTVLSNGTPCLVMEYLEGTDLQHHLAARGRLPPMESVDHILEASAAIAEAHRIGIVHRDIKSSNLFLVPVADRGVTVKVLDFGISKVLPAHETRQAALTQTKDVFGSPLYMSPEQMRASGSIDPRTDIWSLGVVLYEMLSGAPPFAAHSMAEVCAAVLHDAPPAFHPSFAVPRDLEHSIRRCLAKDASQRPATIAELATLLLPFAGPRGVAAHAKISAIAARGGRGSEPNLAALGGPNMHPASRPDATGASFSTTMRRHVRSGFAAAGAGLGVAMLVIVGLVVVWKYRAPETRKAAPETITASAAPPAATSVPVAMPDPPASVAEEPPLPPAGVVALASTQPADAGARPPRRGSSRSGFGGRD